MWLPNPSLPATSQASPPYSAGPGNAVTSLTAELQRTCPLRVPGGVQELLSGCLTQSCCPSFGVPRPQSVSPEPRFPVGRDVLYCSYTGKAQLVGAAGHHHLHFSIQSPATSQEQARLRWCLRWVSLSSCPKPEHWAVPCWVARHRE